MRSIFRDIFFVCALSLSFYTIKHDEPNGIVEKKHNKKAKK